MPASRLAKQQFEALSEFRYQLQRFLRFANDAAKVNGLTPLQYLLLLHVEGYPGRRWASIGEVAERLQRSHHGVVSLVSRCEAAGLVTRRPSKVDRRSVEIHLTPSGARLVHRIAALNRRELQSLASVFRVARISAFNARR
jgi:DNA-binding MarR family transcriptional regulator